MDTIQEYNRSAHPRTIFITDYDMERLQHLLKQAKNENPFRTDLKDLETELIRASRVKSEKVPGDVITMNSKVRLVDRDTAEVSTYTLVFPDQANIGQGMISILATIGTAMLGQRVGDTFD